jgi:hypothetical protein
VAVLALLALSGCSASGSPSVTTPGHTPPEAWTVVRGSDLASALDQVPDIRDGYVF